MKGRRRSKREVKIFERNEMIYDRLDEIQQIAIEERGYKPVDPTITCDVHDYEIHVVHFYNENKQMNLGFPKNHQTISVKEWYCLLCGHYRWSSGVYDPMTRDIINQGVSEWIEE